MIWVLLYLITDQHAISELAISRRNANLRAMQRKKMCLALAQETIRHFGKSPYPENEKKK